METPDHKNKAADAPHADPMQYSGADPDAVARTNEEVDKRLYARTHDDPDEEEEEDEDDDYIGDWGHTDPAEGNSPFPDPMDPSGPGSAV